MFKPEEINDLIKHAIEEARRCYESQNMLRANALYNQVLKVDPSNKTAKHMYGITLHSVGKSEEAKRVLEEFAREYSDDWEGYNSLGVLCTELKDHKAAEKYLRRAVFLNQDHTSPRRNLAYEKHMQGDLNSAEKILRIALKMNDKEPTLWFNLGNVMMEKLDMEAAIDHFHTALELRPRFHNASWNLSLALLSLGRLKEAWGHYESRWNVVNTYTKVRIEQTCSNLHDWEGEDLAGEGILIFCEQGAGDMIHFSRYIKMLKQKKSAERVLLDWPDDVVRGNLSTLLKNMEGVDDLINLDAQEPNVRYKQSVLSLPRIFNTDSYDDIPWDGPYIRPSYEQTLSDLIEDHIDKEKFKIGMVWAGSYVHKQNDMRSCSVVNMLPLMDVPNSVAHFLQFDANDHEDRYKHFATDRVVDWEHTLVDFNDTAAVIKQLDAVVTVDTAVAHLAGAMGHPNVFVALPYKPDWRWGLNNEKTPWYPTMTLVRQKKLGEWKPVFEEISAMLSQLAS